MHRLEYNPGMSMSESTRPLLLRNGSRMRNGRSVEETEYGGGTEGDDLEVIEMRRMEREMDEKKFHNLDESMAASLRIEFDNKCFVEDDLQIDYVIAYEEEDIEAASSSQEMTANGVKSAASSSALNATSEPSEAEKRRNRREVFETNLRRMGLVLVEKATDPTHGRTRYVLIHAPFNVLERQAQLLNVKLPVRQCDVMTHSGRALIPNCLDRLLDKVAFLDFDAHTKLLLEEPDYYTAPYSSDRRTNFVNWDREDLLFPSAERSRMVYDLLIRARYHDPTIVSLDEEEAHYRVGIERLLANGTYTGVYPLHQEFRYGPAVEMKNMNQREILYSCWASWRTWYKYQPLDLVKRYFGTKVGLYFAWLGYYTKTLYPAALLGILAVLFGLFEFTRDPVSKAICDGNGAGGKIMTCPYCDNYCDFQPLKSSCVYAKVSHLFDNTITVVFAALMSVWATLFLEGWKRYHAQVAWKWGLLDFAVEEDQVRPEFQYRVKTTKYNPVTRRMEPYLSTTKQILNLLGSGTTVLFFVILVMGIVFGMMVYRVICLQLLARQNNQTLDNYAFLIVTLTAAWINLFVILIMNYVYYVIALILTRWECPRTQNDFDNSFTIKVFLFQFVNYYSSLFYVAFFKGVISQLPSYQKEKVSGGALTIQGARLEGCDAAGCFAELVIQLAIIMCGRQFFSAFMELGYPLIMSWFRRWQYLLPRTKKSAQQQRKQPKKKSDKSGDEVTLRWEIDYFLSPTYEQWLFDEYLEMVIQFGFITLFVAAFPLAPFFALLNNIMEIRLDAYKFLVTTQRPMPAQSRNIGIWKEILEFLSNFAVTINALVIAFTSDFIPKLYYSYFYDWNLDGYIEWSLSHYDARNLNPSGASVNGSQVVDCRFRGFRNVPCSLYDAPSTPYFNSSLLPEKKRETCDDGIYGWDTDWWKLMALRLAFVVIFEHVVFLVKTIIDYIIPDMPTKIFIMQQREKFLSRKAVLDQIGSQRGSLLDIDRKPHGDEPRHAFQPGDFQMNHLPKMPSLASLDSFQTAASEFSSSASP